MSGQWSFDVFRGSDLDAAEKERLQAAVEKIHAHWTLEKEYLPPPGMGTLATLDSALIVDPPKGLELGYVPIVIRQQSAAENALEPRPGGRL